VRGRGGQGTEDRRRGTGDRRQETGEQVTGNKELFVAPSVSEWMLDISWFHDRFPLAWHSQLRTIDAYGSTVAQSLTLAATKEQIVTENKLLIRALV
jgi:hypothetical protein